MSRATVTLVGLSVVGLGLAAVVTTVPEPERVRVQTPADEVVLGDERALLELGGGAEDALRWVNAFPSEVEGPREGPLRIETEAVPSPLSLGATLVRVTVQASRTEAVPEVAQATITFFDSETTGWRTQSDFRWRDPGQRLPVRLVGLTTGATRTLFLEVDQALRWGGALGVVTVVDANGGHFTAPISRSRALDRASSDFRFSMAVLLTMQRDPLRKPELVAVSQALVADSAPGVPWREHFVERFVPEPFTLVGTGVFKVSPSTFDDKDTLY